MVEVVPEYDVLIFATGFDAVSGALTRIDIRGNNDLLRDELVSGPRAFIAVTDSEVVVRRPRACARRLPGIELQVGWIAEPRPGRQAARPRWKEQPDTEVEVRLVFRAPTWQGDPRSTCGGLEPTARDAPANGYEGFAVR